MAGLVFCKGICTCISGMKFYFMKEDVGLRVLDSIRKNVEEVSLDMVTVLLWYSNCFLY